MTALEANQAPPETAGGSTFPEEPPAAPPAPEAGPGITIGPGNDPADRAKKPTPIPEEKEKIPPPIPLSPAGHEAQECARLERRRRESQKRKGLQLHIATTTAVKWHQQLQAQRLAGAISPPANKTSIATGSSSAKPSPGTPPPDIQ